MNRIRRLAAAPAGVLLAFAGAAPAALAHQSPSGPPGWDKHPTLPPSHWDEPVNIPVRTVIIGGMPGWQIAVIAIGAALLAATAAVLLDRAGTTAKLSRWPGRATPAAPGAASAGQDWPQSMTISSRLRTMIAPGLLPQTMQLCSHCQPNLAESGVSQEGVSDELDRSRSDVIAFGSRTDPDGFPRSQSRPSLI
jgi:hypothetical protein